MTDTAFVLIVLAVALCLALAVLRLSKWTAARRDRFPAGSTGAERREFAERRRRNDWFMRQFAAVVEHNLDLYELGERIAAEDLYVLPEGEA